MTINQEFLEDEYFNNVHEFRPEILLGFWLKYGCFKTPLLFKNGKTIKSFTFVGIRHE